MVFIIIFFENQYDFAQSLNSKRPKIGLVLSGGGAKGLAHIGVLKVLEEAGIYPDYIGGTSMGGIVGGLYAIGYTADSLDHIVRSIPWNYFLSEKIPRRNITLEEKEDQDRFVLSFPIKGKKIQIPSSVINGQKIENSLNKLCSPVYNIRDFSKFKIPFFCIATDIVSGKEVILNKGYLPAALRATMSIPSIFTPVEIDGHLLVDGGLVNSLPAQRVKEMGAEIIIGVNVGFHTYSKDELNSIFHVIEQSLLLNAIDLNNKNKAICNILISPDMSRYNKSSFNSADSIIDLGEKAARKIFSRLKFLGDSLKFLDPEYVSHQEIPSLDSIQLKEINFTGLEKVSQRLVSGKLQLAEFQKVTPKDIELAIDRVYSSLYFDNVTYEIRQVEGGAALNIHLSESKGGLIHAGIHYDSNNKSAILLNMTWRNLVLNGSKLSINTALGENPYFSGSLIINNGWKPGFGFNFVSSKNLMYFYQNSSLISTINNSTTKVQLYTQSILKNSFGLGMGIEYENTIIKPVIDPVLGIEKKLESFINYFGFIHMDSYDNAFYPNQGAKLHSELKLITASHDYSPVGFLCSQFSVANKISKRVSIIGHLSGGAADGDSIPLQYMIYTGGLTDNFRNGILPFTGLEYMENSYKNALLAGIDIQIRFWENLYLILKGNAGNTNNNFNELFTYNELLSGYGMTLGYDSYFGPIELTLSRSDNQKEILGYFRIGFYF